MSVSSTTTSTQSSNKKHKVVVFDVDETLGNFAQFSIFLHVLEDYFKIPDVTYQHFNDLVDLYPEIIRPNMVRILDYIRKKKTAGLCRKVIIYTNNMGPDKWVTHIRRYFEYKLKEITVASQSSKGLLIVPPLFDRLIGGYKPEQAPSNDGYPQRTTNDKTMNDLIYCSRLPADIEVCFLDDLYHSKMTDERVYYIKLQSYYAHISMDTFVLRFLNSALFKEVFSRFDPPSSSIIPSMSATVKRKILSIEIHDMFSKYANALSYDAKAVQRKMNPREIDEIISKYILYHLQQFFRDGPPPVQSPGSKLRRLSSLSSKTAKKKGHSGHNHHHHHDHPSNVFYVDKASAVKNMRNKTVRNR
jgi:hypothetical protein